jgi:hypothetical protein
MTDHKMASYFESGMGSGRGGETTAAKESGMGASNGGVETAASEFGMGVSEGSAPKTVSTTSVWARADHQIRRREVLEKCLTRLKTPSTRRSIVSTPSANEASIHEIYQVFAYYLCCHSFSCPATSISPCP